MTHFTAFDPKTELNGGTVLALTRNILAHNIADILEKHGLSQIDPNAWYPLQAVLNVLSDVSEQRDATSNFVSIGMKAGELGAQRLPEELSNLSPVDFFMHYGEVYQSRHRNGDAGFIRAEKTSDTHVKVSMKTPYPDDLYYGVIYAYARYLAVKQGKQFTVKYDEKLPRRDNGGSVTIVDITIS